MQQNRMYNNLLELCSIPSISETSGELAMAEKIHNLLQRIDYFKAHPELAQICPVQGDKLGRSFVYALMEGRVKSPQTVILLSHFDVVGVEEYGMQKDLAFDPAAYTQFLKDNPQVQLPEEARADLESGDYLFGRGVMDMKFGIAADIEILIKAEKDLANFEGNILFLAVPDEEANSAGMLSAVELLLALKKERLIEYTCCLVSEPHFPKYPGDSTKYIYTGTVGKLLPVFYCAGRETHVGEPFSGLNPNLLTARIIEKVDSNPELADSAGGAHTPTPVCLKQADTKTAYSVQTPAAAYTYFNFMTLTRTPGEVMQIMLAVAGEAFAGVLTDIGNKAAKLSEITGNRVALPDFEPRVISFLELYEWCSELHGDKFRLHIRYFIESCRPGGERPGDLRQLSIEIVKEALKFCPYKDPIIVVFFAPPFYPHSDMQSPGSQVVGVCQYIVELAGRFFSEDLQIEPFFPGLSDMSYMGLSKRVNTLELPKNFPVWDAGYSIPLETIAQLNIPFINLGPLGKDAHKHTERLCLSYSFQKAAPLIWAAVRRLLGHPVRREDLASF